MSFKLSSYLVSRSPSDYSSVSSHPVCKSSFVINAKHFSHARITGELNHKSNAFNLMKFLCYEAQDKAVIGFGVRILYPLFSSMLFSMLSFLIHVTQSYCFLGLRECLSCYKPPRRTSIKTDRQSVAIESFNRMRLFTSD